MKIAIVEDDNIAANILTEYLNRYAGTYSEHFDISRFASAESFLYKYVPQFDLVFMDIELPGINGMDACRELRKTDAAVTIVFVTNMAQYACNGYEVDALDFIVKPISYADFSLKLKKAVKVVKTNAEVDVLVPKAGGFSRVSSSRLMYVEVMGHTIKYHLTDSVLEARGSLAEVEKILSGCGFLRCNNCFLVNPRYIVSVHGFTVKVGDESLPISQPRKKEFMSRLTEYLLKGGQGKMPD